MISLYIKGGLFVFESISVLQDFQRPLDTDTLTSFCGIDNVLFLELKVESM